MRFQIKTLVDVTETQARKGQDKKLVNQQDNFNTLYNTIGLRTNPSDFKITTETQSLTDLTFGKKYKGKQKIWTIEFFVEQEASTSVDMMIDDFDLVPIITGLDETIKLDTDMFITSKNKDLTNIIFIEIDK